MIAAWEEPVLGGNNAGSMRRIADAPRAQHTLRRAKFVLVVAGEARLDERGLVEPLGSDNALLRVPVLQARVLHVVPLVQARRGRDGRRKHSGLSDPRSREVRGLELVHAQRAVRLAGGQQHPARAHLHRGQRASVAQSSLPGPKAAWRGAMACPPGAPSSSTTIRVRCNPGLRSPPGGANGALVRYAPPPPPRPAHLAGWRPAPRRRFAPRACALRPRRLSSCTRAGRARRGEGAVPSPKAGAHSAYVRYRSDATAP
eukprot:scaffold14398_cov83-Phaeocystis_antarctica.AAC.2